MTILRGPFVPVIDDYKAQACRDEGAAGTDAEKNFKLPYHDTVTSNRTGTTCIAVTTFRRHFARSIFHHKPSLSLLSGEPSQEDAAETG